MFPITCIQLPCRNIELTSVTGMNAAGTTPHCCTNTDSCSRGIDSSKNQPSAFRTMMATVMNGVVRDGMTSRRGIMPKC